MGVDLGTYRARIGCFVPREKKNRAFATYRHVLNVRSLCPSAKILLLSLCIAQLLLCAGDVEANPGPDRMDQVLATLQGVIASNEKNQKQTTATLAGINAGIADISRRVSHLEESLREVTLLKEEVKSLNLTVSNLKTDMGGITTRLHRMEDVIGVVDDLNNRLRRNNLIVKGLPEQERETWNDTENNVHAFFLTHLNLTCGEIERAHRIGRPRAGTIRPIVIKFLNYKSKCEVLSNAHRLKNLISPKVWIEEDFSPSIQLARKKLRDYAKANRGTNRFRLSYDKLTLNDVVYSYDANSDRVISVSQGNTIDHRA